MKQALLQSLEAQATQFKDVIIYLARGFAGLFIASQWAHGTIFDLLNAETLEKRNTLTSVFVKSTLEATNTVGLIVSYLPMFTRKP